MYKMPLERGKIGEFARAVGSENPDHQGPTAIIPTTFLTTSDWFWDPEGGVSGDVDGDYSRVLHGAEEYIFPAGPPEAGQELQVERRVVDHYEKLGKRGGKLRFVVVEHRFRNGRGHLVAVQRSTTIVTGQPPVQGQ